MNRLLVALVVVLLSLAASSASAQTADKAWIDINVVSAKPAQDATTFTFRDTVFNEPASVSAAYPAMPRATGGLFGGGVRVARGFGVAVQFVNAQYEYDSGLAISIPHPFVFNRLGTDTDVTDTLERKERALDLSGVYQLPTPEAWRVRVFGGPTYFKLKQEMVQDVEFTQSINIVTFTNTVNITDFRQDEVDQSAWGFHVGADAAYFFSRHVGVGGTVRFNRGTVTLDNEPLSEEEGELKVGATIVGGGLRLRF